MRHSLILVIVCMTLCGCASTRSVRVEIRTKKDAPKIERVNCLGSTAVGAGPAKFIRRDREFEYFSYHDIVHGIGRGHIVLDIEKANRSEVYGIKWHMLGCSTNWTEWRRPDTVQETEAQNGRVAAMQILYGENRTTTNIIHAVTELRYQLEKLDY